jgi:MOSC domain-containing protein YiiM
MRARVVALHVHERHGDRPRPVDEVAGRAGGGIVGDSHERRTTRAVLVVDRSTLEALGLRPGDLREQITVVGLPGLTSLEPGTLLGIGDLALRVNGPCEPCTHIGELLDVADPEVFRLSLEGRRGVVCTVVQAGLARRGAAVDVLSEAASLR